MEGTSKVKEMPVNNEYNKANESIEVGLNKLQNTLESLQHRENEKYSILSSDEEQEETRNNDKNKPKKNRELEELEENQILSARLRSESGRVYSSGLVIGSNNKEIGSGQLSVLQEDGEQNPDCSQDEDKEMFCSKGQCCKNTSKIVMMIKQLQSSVDAIQKSSNTQALVSAGNAGTIRRVEDLAKRNEGDITDLEKELDEYKFQLKLITNVVIKQDQQIASLTKKINNAQQREMYPNLVISGIIEKPRENTLQVYNRFVQNQLEIQELIPAHRAYRIGTGRARPLIVELRDPITQKGKIYSQVNKLKEKRNEEGGRFFVSDHLPEEYNENRRRINDIITENRKKTSDEKLTMSVNRGRLMIEDEPYSKAIITPGPKEILKRDEKLWKLAEEIEMFKGEEEKLHKSEFVAYAAAIQDLNDVQAAYLRVKTKFSASSHVVCAYRLPGKSPTLQDYLDDGEFGAGRVILNLLRDEKVMNVVVFMIRQHGGQNLGPIRFDLIRKVSLSAITRLRKEVAEMKRKDEEKRLADLEAIRQQSIQQVNEWSGWTSQEGPQEEWGNDQQKKVD